MTDWRTTTTCVIDAMIFDKKPAVCYAAHDRRLRTSGGSQAVAHVRHATRWSRCGELAQFGCASALASTGWVRTAQITPAISSATPIKVSICGQLWRSTNA